MPNLGASIYKKKSRADVSSANFLSVMLDPASSVGMWQSPLRTAPLVSKSPCSCSPGCLAGGSSSCWSPLRPRRGCPRGVGLARCNALPGFSLCWGSSRGGSCCSCPKQRAGEAPRSASGGVGAPLAHGHRRGVLPPKSISFHCEQ